MASLKHQLISYLAPLYYYGRYRRLCRSLDECLHENRELLCFFPAYHTGGAEKVHLQILEAVRGQNVASIIAHKSKNDALRPGYARNSRCLVDLHAIGNHAFFRKRLARRIAARVNDWKKPATLFGCNNELFYDVVDLLRNPQLKIVDLLHAFAPYQEGIEQRSIHSVLSIGQRIVINQKTKDDYADQYRRLGLPEDLLQRIRIIPNALSMECPDRPKDFRLPFRCLFVGRHSPEKRLEVFLEVARQAGERGIPVLFTVVGADEGGHAAKNVRFLGAVTNEVLLSSIYDEHHFLLTTSVYEGFPLTIMEAMCHGLINISTAVGGIPEHIRDGETGFLVADDTRIDIIAEAFTTRLESLVPELETLPLLSAKSRHYVRATFSPERFIAAYRALLTA